MAVFCFFVFLFFVARLENCCELSEDVSLTTRTEIFQLIYSSQHLHKCFGQRGEMGGGGAGGEGGREN